MKKNILVTGGCGFIGGNFIHHILEQKNDDITIVNLDNLTYAASPENLAPFESNPNYHFVRGSISNSELVSFVFEKYNINHVVHFAAESHVDNSIKGPKIFFETNILGTFNLLQTAFHHWMNKPFDIKENHKSSRFLHVSTDEVYGTLGKEGLFTEDTPYAPNSPYSASKASSDFVVRSFFHTYGLPVVTTNCSNNYGPFQHNEKLIPTIIRNAIQGSPIPIYGKGENIRDWLFVRDHCDGIYTVLKKGRLGECYNIGGESEKNNLEIVNAICEKLDNLIPRNVSYKNQITFVEDRFGHDFRYAIDISKINKELKWKPSENFESGIEKTIDWYLKKYQK